MSKLKGSRLETEVDKVRTDGNWKRLSELLPSVKSKNSGLEDSYELFQGEIILETFLEQLGEVLRPHKENHEKLKSAESYLITAVKEKANNNSVFMEASILLAKVYYACTEYAKALNLIDASGMEKGTNPFRTLRALRLVAEGYAVKGLCLESFESPIHTHSLPLGSASSFTNEQKAINCFEKSAELAISYINELEKTLNSNSSKGNTSTSGSLPTPANGTRQPEKIGDLLERCLERVAMLRAKDTVAQRKNGSEGIEWYRRIITCLGDKSTGERLQLKMSRQLAELLIRAAVPSEDKSASEAMNMKSQNLNFYTGSHRGYFAPSSRVEEIVLLLLISEVLSTREVVLSRSEELTSSRIESLQNAKSAYNLLTLVLSTLRQYHILANIYERAMKFANNDSFLWQQFALSSICRGRYARAARVLEQSIMSSNIDSESSPSKVRHRAATVDQKENDGDESALHLTNNPSCALSVISEYLLLSQLYIEKFGNYKSAIEYSEKAIELCSKDGQLTFLKARCQLIHAIATGQNAMLETAWESKKSKLASAVKLIEECVSSDPHDYLALYYSAYYHALSRDLESAKDRCSRSLALNGDQPAAVMLLALIFTAYGDLKGALELVVTSLQEFETNYGLLVLKLQIETKFGRIEESLDTCTHLLDFWKKRDAMTIIGHSGGVDEDKSQATLNGMDSNSVMLGRDGSMKTGTPSLGREISTPVVPGAPLSSFSNTVPLLNSLPTNASGMDISIADSGVTISDNGHSSASDSGTNTASADAWSRFRAQADIWMSLTELYLAEGRLADVTKCVEQAIGLFPQSPQAIYMKGRLLGCRAENLKDRNMASKIRGEAKSTYLSALALCPNHVQSMSALAKLYEAEGNQMMAEHMLREMVRNDPLNCNWWQQLGCSLMRRGEADQATECLTAASNLDRSTPLLPFSFISPVFPAGF
ncbi:unnamed protein product [Caenorhabditis bovis]|uniref:Tetratricopeptide repeat protein 7 N-terminal domain-containing protein n=1 Tax=Caenorhabditis bovis TaxID=2654633 RepID=A0A8S1EPL4_9PELO|nr:unnamed protein product [Caenorhabditis bovis]